ncbi:MAG: hypothetical protein QW837_05855 [Conexivisphaerales archaeon]
MRSLNLNVGCGLYDRTFALKYRFIKPRALHLKFTEMYPPELFFKMIRHSIFDVAELSLSSYIMAKMDGYEYVAIPVFPVRRFRHSFIFINRNSGVNKAQDLAGKTIGVYNYEITAAVWIRGVLQHEYDVLPTDIKWITTHEERLEFKRQSGLSITLFPGQDLVDMLIRGKIDALITPIIDKRLISSSEVRRLFEDHKRVEEEYFRRTHIFPIMHVIVVRKKLTDKYPWITKSLLDAFRDAKKWWYDYIYNVEWQTNQLFFAWFNDMLEEERQIMGYDPYPYNIIDNRSVITTLIGYMHEQGLIKKAPLLEELFDRETFNDNAR